MTVNKLYSYHKNGYQIFLRDDYLQKGTVSEVNNVELLNEDEARITCL